MGSDFPVPRDKLPRLDVSPHEREERKLQMEKVLLKTMDEYDHFLEVDERRVDSNRWKLAETREQLQLYRGRSNSGSSSGTGNLSAAPTPKHSTGSSGSEGRPSVDSSETKRTSMLLVGQMPGTVQKAAFSVLTKTQEEFSLVSVFLHDNTADAALLKILEGPTPENPYHFLGYKWFAKRSPGGGHFVKHRDTLYVEYIGMTKMRNGDDVAYLLVESVQLPGFPEMPERNCIRAYTSISFLVRQKSENMLDVYMTGVVDPGGKISRFGAMLTNENAFMIARTMELAEARRLTKMIITQRQARDEAIYGRRFQPTTCSLCHQQRKFYNGVTLVDCSICGSVICSRCRTHRRVFFSDVSLGRFHRISCCKTCVLAANDPNPNRPPVPLKVSISAQLQRQNSSRDFSNLSDSFHASRPRSSSDSSAITTDMINELSLVDSFGTGRGNSRQPPVPATAASTSASAVPRRGSVDEFTAATGNVRRYGNGVTLLDTTSIPLADRTEPPAFNTTGHSSSGNLPLVAMGPSTSRGDAITSSRSGAATSSALVIPPPRATRDPTPDFVSSAPGSAYDLRRTRTAPQQPAVQPSHQNDLFARMMELRRLAESTYQTTQQNQTIMEAQQTPLQGRSHFQ